LGALTVETNVTKNRPRLLIIAPAWSQGWWGRGKVLAPPLVLPLLGGLTPPDVDVRLIDENVEPVDYSDCDMAGISLLVYNAPIGYEIAERWMAHRWLDYDYNITPSNPTDTNLVGYWNFDYDDGDIVRDSSPNGNHGKLGSADSTGAAGGSAPVIHGGRR